MKDLTREHWPRVIKEETSARKEKWKSAVPTRSRTRILFRSKSTILLLLWERRPRLADRCLIKMAVQEEQVVQDWKAENRVKIFWKGTRNRHVIYGTLPFAWITSLSPDARKVTVVISNTLRLVGSAVKSQRKVAEKGSVACLKENIHVGCVSQDGPQKKCNLREVGKLGSNHAVMFSKTTMSHTRNRERKGQSQGVKQKRVPQGANSVRCKIFGKNGRWNPESGVMRS